MKVGLNVRINVSKIDKSKLYKGEKGVYLNMTTFVDLDQEDEYGNNGFISMEQSKEQRDAGEQSVILGNVKKFWIDGATASAPQSDMSLEELDEDIPF
jgi:hypothetical protein|tara:strand:- start:37 stop:330 length:294 start_codon:yes stop_codon:yes gene_type:complete